MITPPYSPEYKPCAYVYYGDDPVGRTVARRSEIVYKYHMKGSDLICRGNFKKYEVVWSVEVI